MHCGRGLFDVWLLHLCPGAEAELLSAGITRECRRSLWQDGIFSWFASATGLGCSSAAGREPRSQPTSPTVGSARLTDREEELWLAWGVEATWAYCATSSLLAIAGEGISGSRRHLLSSPVQSSPAVPRGCTGTGMEKSTNRIENSDAAGRARRQR
ncbi:hypothetical protein CONLIGDRAFT_89343 [Coniochaeta ligniaria NRRL 30616]|uniref:Uncharacterized protein n=1 Tax=Coniochaeta ligniaria NRRL 30616 TaxID=1408157 RepID=A0A1J7ICA2_9PEZI|nr:hypothetical protein CONLIGDRAFT_89343 [Coniochaeta ligniaria NRRL 30616]